MVSLRFVVPPWLGMPIPPPEAEQLERLPAGAFVGKFFDSSGEAVRLALGGLFLLLLLRFLLRKQWLALGAWVLILGAMMVGGEALMAMLVGAAILLIAVLLTRFGLLPFAVCLLVAVGFSTMPLVLDLSAWYADRSLIALLIYAALAFYGFQTALAGRPLLGGQAARRLTAAPRCKAFADGREAGEVQEGEPRKTDGEALDRRQRQVDGK